MLHRAREESLHLLEECQRAVMLLGLRVLDSSCGQGLRLVLPGASMGTEIQRVQLATISVCLGLLIIPAKHRGRIKAARDQE